jgi:hypothetical protein
MEAIDHSTCKAGGTSGCPFLAHPCPHAFKEKQLQWCITFDAQPCAQGYCRSSLESAASVDQARRRCHR